MPLRLNRRLAKFRKNRFFKMHLRKKRKKKRKKRKEKKERKERKEKRISILIIEYLSRILQATT